MSTAPLLPFFTIALTACLPVGGLFPKDDTGGTAAVDALVFEPSSYDFGEVSVGATTLGELALRNGGDEPVELASLAVEGDTFALVTDPVLPADIDAGAAVILTVAYEPDDEGMHGGVLIATPSSGEVVTAVLTGVGLAPREVTDELTINNPAVDLLFSADQSGSMDDDLASLARAFGSFIEVLSETTTDWRILVVNDDDGCSTSGVLTPTSPGYEETFERAIRSGGGYYTESLLTVATQALAQTDAGGCNEGFLRDDALLHVIVTSDEPDQSTDSWGAYVTAMEAHKPQVQQLRFSAVAGDYPTGCDNASAGTGYYEAVLATEGVFLSICDRWQDNAPALASASAWIWQVPLSETPDPDTLAVTVEGSAREDGWHYDSDINAVTFDEGFPKAYHTVQVSYTVGSGG